MLPTSSANRGRTRGDFPGPVLGGSGEIVAGGPWKVGEATELTQIAVIEAESFLEAGGIDEALIYDRFVRWAEDPATKDLGISTRQVLGRTAGCATLPGFVPPDRYPSSPSVLGGIWWGEAELWTVLPQDGSTDHEGLRNRAPHRIGIFVFPEGAQGPKVSISCELRTPSPGRTHQTIWTDKTPTRQPS